MGSLLKISWEKTCFYSQNLPELHNTNSLTPIHQKCCKSCQSNLTGVTWQRTGMCVTRNMITGWLTLWQLSHKKAACRKVPWVKISSFFTDFSILLPSSSTFLACLAQTRSEGNLFEKKVHPMSWGAWVQDCLWVDVMYCDRARALNTRATSHIVIARACARAMDTVARMQRVLSLVNFLGQ